LQPFDPRSLGDGSKLISALLAAGATFVLFCRRRLPGQFSLSFAAVGTIILKHSMDAELMQRRDEGLFARLTRQLSGCC
jgi:hypothetical protein